MQGEPLDAGRLGVANVDKFNAEEIDITEEVDTEQFDAEDPSFDVDTFCWHPSSLLIFLLFDVDAYISATVLIPRASKRVQVISRFSMKFSAYLLICHLY